MLLLNSAGLTLHKKSGSWHNSEQKNTDNPCCVFALRVFSELVLVRNRFDAQRVKCNCHYKDLN